MLLTQGKIVREWRCFFALFFGLSLFGYSSFAGWSGLSGVSLGGTLPTAMGYAYQTLDRASPIGVQAESWFDGSWIHDSFLLHSTFSYEPMMVRNNTGINVNTFSGFVGVQIQRGNYLNALSFFFSIDIGAMYSWMTFSSVSSSTANSAVSFASQIVPGFDFPVYGRFGIVGEMPIRMIYMKTTLVIFDPTISVRFKL